MKTRETRIIFVVLVTTFSIFSLLGFEQNPIFADTNNDYDMVEDVKAMLTFTFRDGVEVHDFPVFIMTSDFVSNEGTFFKVQGVVGNAPYLHKALDEAFKFRLMKTTGGNSFEYNYRFFDVDVEFLRGEESILTLAYSNCEVDNYLVETLNSNDYESYFSSKSGFAIVDTIEFQCGGVKLVSGDGPILDNQSRTGTLETVYNYDKLPYKYAENVRTFVTLQHDNGIERIEFPVFEIISGFGEEVDTPEFKVEGILNNYPLLNDAIDKSRNIFGQRYTYNLDFDAKVEFVQASLLDGEKLLREIDYTDCIVDSSKIVTLYDKEEGFTGKRGFAIVQQIEFSCEGMKPLNPGYDAMYPDTTISRSSFLENSQMKNDYNMGTGPHAIVTFDFNNARETTDYQIFTQSTILTKSNPTFRVEGIVGDYPLLYKRVDDAAKIDQISGGSMAYELFDVDVNLVYDGFAVRGFSYSDCRVVDYVVKTLTNNEETYFIGHALSNTFEFECYGYASYDPIYNAMFDVDKAKTLSSRDLLDTSTWNDQFKSTKP